MVVVATCFAILLPIIGSAQNSSKIVIDKDMATPYDEKQIVPQIIGFRPADGAICEVNPPRFSWAYTPEIVPGDDARMPWTSRWGGGGHALAYVPKKFTMLIADNPDFKNPTINKADIEFNFYNALPVLKGAEKWYWKIGYDVGSSDEKWSDVRSFTFAENATEWDREVLGKLDKVLTGRPRLYQVAEKYSASGKNVSLRAEVRHNILAKADAFLSSEKCQPGFLPESDAKDLGKPGRFFLSIADEVANCGFAYNITKDKKYLQAKHNLLKLATYPIGGTSSPEDFGDNKLPTRIASYMAIFLDFCWHELTRHERDVLIKCIEWRLDASINHYFWKRKGKYVWAYGTSLWASSHPYEALYWNIYAGLVLYGESDVAKQYLKYALNFMVGVTGVHGNYEACNEGGSYTSWKFTTQLHHSIAVYLTIPGFDVFKNPFYKRLSELMMARELPGLYKTGSGHGGSYPFWEGLRYSEWVNLALIYNDDPRYFETFKGFQRLEKTPVNSKKDDYMYSQTFYHLLSMYDFNTKKREHEVFNTKTAVHAGWASAATYDFNDVDRWEDNVGINFWCRSRGGYSHSFPNENSFDLYAYGKVIATGGGLFEKDALCGMPMAHNVVLFDGRGQEGLKIRQFHPNKPSNGRIIAKYESDSLAYWCGDATWAIQQTIPELEYWLRHVIFVDRKYFIFYDDIKLKTGKKKTLSWLYNYIEKMEPKIDAGKNAFSYKLGNVNVKVQHFFHKGELDIVSMVGSDKLCKNLITGEEIWTKQKAKLEYRALKKNKTVEQVLKDSNPLNSRIWVNTKEKVNEFDFLSVIIPWKDGMKEPTAIQKGKATIQVLMDGMPKTISFEANKEADMFIDVNGIWENCANDVTVGKLRLPKYVSFIEDKKYR